VQIHIPEEGEKASSLPTFPPEPGRININTASAEELDTLPGIGPVLAQRIIDYRNKEGPFQRVEDLAKVSGIGYRTLEKLRDLITLGEPP
jgi:competence protein ComEA